MKKKPNVLYVFGDQWRQQATGFNGDPNVNTPHLDKLANESLNLVNAQAGCPVCCPSRASLMTGQDILTHGVFLNDISLQPKGPTIAEVFLKAGYDTAYIGKWHLEGKGRSKFIPPERHMGFQYWKALECTHNYNNSAYYSGHSDEIKYWNGYDAFEQTKDAEAYIRNHDRNKPFFMMLSWGGPHEPYETAPENFRKMYDPDKIQLRPNVTSEIESKARNWLAGYYAHCTALDECIAILLDALKTCNLEEDTIFIFTSDHGDMLGSQGHVKKQRPWDESIRIPFLLRYPKLFQNIPKKLNAFIDMPDIMPTLLGLCDIEIPNTVEGFDMSNYLTGDLDPKNGSALIKCIAPFGQWTKAQGGKAFRGIRTDKYTFVRDLNGPWLLYDNLKDPYQLNNLVENPKYSKIKKSLEHSLIEKLKKEQDKFLPGEDYIKHWGYIVDASGTVPYSN